MGGRGVESLSDDELAALVRFVRALVDHDQSVLRESGAYDDGGDPHRRPSSQYGAGLR
jgi:hypothetical protein